jgi:hypothetical protein
MGRAVHTGDAEAGEAHQDRHLCAVMRLVQDQRE